MNPDDEICYCLHVPYRKLRNYARRHKLQKPSQMSECLGAGTGCGWCIPVLKKIFEAARNEQSDAEVLDMTAEEYARLRHEYIENDTPRNDF